MAHRWTRDHWHVLWLPVPDHRTRIVVALIGFLLILGAPVVILLTGDRQIAAHPLPEPAGLGVTGALPGNALPADTVPGHAVPSDPPGGSIGTGAPGTTVPHPVPGDAVGAGPPRLAVPHALPGDAVGAGPSRLTATHPASRGVPGDAASAEPSGVAVPLKLPEGPLRIPGVMLSAYQRAAQTLAATRPGCHLSWSVLAGIGRIESDHASGGRVDTVGTTLGPILGPRLDGSPGMAAIPDTDHGVLDGDPVWDRAVGPMQFIPSSWRSWGVGSPHNIYDSTLAAGRYLCAGNADLSDPVQLRTAVYRYNHSATYVDVVLRWAAAYLTGVITTPSAPGLVPPGTNGNGGRPIVPDPVPPASAELAADAQHAPLTATRPTTTTGPHPPPASTTTPSTPTTPTATTNPPPPPTTTTTLPKTRTAPASTSAYPPPPTPTRTPPVPTKSPVPTTSPPLPVAADRLPVTTHDAG